MQLRENRTLHAILFFTFATVLSLCAGEIAIRIISNKLMIYNIEMLKYGIELKMRDPMNELTHVHKANSFSHLMGVDISLNSMGHRSRELITPKPVGEKRIYAAGSSVTMGWGVPEKQVFSFLAEESLNQFGQTKYNFINAGVGNYNTISSIKMLHRRFNEIKPDMVILQYFIADVEPREMGRDNWLLQKTYLGSYFYNDIRGIVFRNSYSNLFEYYNKLYQDDSIPWQQTLSQILQLKNFLAEKEVPLLIVIIPDFHNLSNESPYQALYQKMQSAFQSMDIQTLNTFPQLQALYGNRESQLWVQPNDPHPNAVAHSVMASLLLDYFAKNKTLDTGL